MQQNCIKRWFWLSYFGMIWSENAGFHTLVLGNQPHPFGFFDGLRSAAYLKLFEQARAMCLDGVERNKQFSRNFIIAHALGHQLQHLEFAFADAERLALGLVEHKIGRQDGFLFDDNRLGLGQFDGEPHAKCRKNHRDGTGIDLESVAENDVPQFEPAQHKKQYGQRQSVVKGRFVSGKWHRNFGFAYPNIKTTIGCCELFLHLRL